MSKIREKYFPSLKRKLNQNYFCVELSPSSYSLKSHVKNEHMVLRCREEGCSFATKSALLMDNHMVDTHQKAVKVCFCTALIAYVGQNPIIKR